MNSKTIQQLLRGHYKFVKDAEQAARYYRGYNRIKEDNSVLQRQAETEQAVGNPLHLADNRISHSWHNLLVTQKVAYALTYPPTFDTGDDAVNEKIAQTLGDNYTATAMQLGVDASNAAVGWLHYWKGADGSFKYHTVDPVQIVPVYSGTLESELVGVLRCYTTLEPETGKTAQICEYWDDKVCKFYKQSGVSGTYITFEYPEVGEELVHGLGAVPFIPFYNNSARMGDLPLYRDLIDAYDKVVSGFANDMEDVQEVIFVIKNYGGEDKKEFLSDLKKSKVIKVDGDGGVDTIRAEIPFEARNAFLERTRKQIFESGMGVDPDPANFGNASGVALKFLYSLLEMKTGQMETQFRKGFAELVRAICRVSGFAEPKRIIQTWTRNRIQNDTETAQIATQSVGILSEQTILANHPWVEDVSAEVEQLEEEEANAAKKETQYNFPAQKQSEVKGGGPDAKKTEEE